MKELDMIDVIILFGVFSGCLILLIGTICALYKEIRHPWEWR